MLASAVSVIGVARFGLVPALSQMAGALKWSSKARGQATGFATSSPELVALVASGLAGVWNAGLWNIASSNIINLVLALVATLYYGRGRDLLAKRFWDELGFSILAVFVPIGLMLAHFDTHVATVPLLLLFFVIYKIADRKLNAPEEFAETDTPGSLGFGILMALTSLALIAFAGVYLGGATREVVTVAGVPAAATGWILGFVTSLPEMVTFFSVYADAAKKGREAGLEETQEVLDNLAASNASNTGIIYPIGLAVYLTATGLLVF